MPVTPSSSPSLSWQDTQYLRIDENNENQNAVCAGSYDPVFLGTTESFSPSLLSDCITTPGIHVGVSGWYNYELAWKTHATAIAIIDTNPCVIELHRKTIQLISENKNIHDFIEKSKSVLYEFVQKHQVIIAAPNEDHVSVKIQLKAKHSCNIQEAISEFFKRETERKTSWLASSQAYEYIREVIQRKAIWTFQGNISHTNLISSVLQETSDAKISSLYISNCIEWIAPFGITAGNLQEVSAFEKAILSYPYADSNTLIIDSVRPKSHENIPLQQRATYLKNWSRE